MKKNARVKSGFGMVSKLVMKDPSISLREKGLYAYLSTFADSDSNELTPGVNKIAEECGVSVATVKRILNALKDKNVLLRQTRGQNKSYKTTLLK